MGARKILILFFSTMTVSLVILIVLFNLFFKNINMDFETKNPESAPTIKIEQDLGNENNTLENEPDLSGIYTRSADFKAKGVTQSKVRVPGQRLTSTQTQVQTRPKKKSVENPSSSSFPPAPKIVNSSGHITKAPMLQPKIPRVPVPGAHTLYQVYIDGFTSKSDAQTKVAQLKASGIDAFVNTSGRHPIVKLGTFSSPEGAQVLASQHGAKVKKIN